MAKKPRPPKKAPRKSATGQKKGQKKNRGRRGAPLGLMIVALVALAVVLTAGVAVVVSSQAGERSARMTVATDLGGSQAVQTAFQQQRYQRLNLISRIFATDQVLTSYLAEAARARDEAAILASVEEYQNLLTFDLAVVMDRNGVVLTRTDSRAVESEDLSETPLVAVALEESKASGVWQQGEQLYHAVAVPLVRQFELVGYIAVAYAINNTLAVQTKRAGGAETVFLANSATGPAATASTLDDNQTTALIGALRTSGDVLARVMERGETASDVELELGGERWVAFLSPLRDAGGQSIGAVVALTSVADQIGAFQQIRLLTLGAALVALVLGALLAMMIARGVEKPMRRVADAVEAVSQGQWETPLPGLPGDAGRVSRALREHLGQLREKTALEFVAGRVSRLLPEPAKGAAQAQAQSTQACLLGIELRRYADAKLGYDPEENVARFNRDVQRVSTSASTQQGRILSVCGHRLLVAFEGSGAGYRALSAAAEIMLTLSQADSVFDEPNPPSLALSTGQVLAGSVPVGESAGAVMAGLPVQMLESLMREAAPGGIYFTKEVYQELAQAFQQSQIEVKGQRGILTPQPLYFVDADAAARATGAKAMAETTSQVSGEARSLADLRPGVVLAGRFDLLSEIGGGRLGVVWKAQDRDLGDLVTLKMLRPEVVQDAVQFDRLKRSVARARSIRHPNVLSVLDFGEADRMPYIEAEYARGMTLAYVLEQARQVPIVAGVRMARQIAWALGAAHGQQLLHGGLKPENILVETAGGNIRVMDFGLQAPVRPGVEIPQPGFFAPEQLEGREPDSRADFFSYGVVLFYALTGKLPYPGASVGEVRQRIASESPPAPTSLVAEIPPKLEAAIMKCLSPNPDGRYSTVGELIGDLDDVKV